MKNLAIIVNNQSVRRWVLLLKDEMGSMGAHVGIYALHRGAQKQLPLLERGERALGIASFGLTDWIDDAAPLLDEGEDTIDETLWLDLTGTGTFAPRQGRILRPRFNGRLSEFGVMVGIEQTPPVIEIELKEKDRERIIHRAVVGVSDRQFVVRTLDSCFAQLIPLLLDATAHLLLDKQLPPLVSARPHHEGSAAAPWTLAHLRHGYGRKIANQLTKSFVRRDDWAIAIRRRVPDSGNTPVGELDVRDFTILPCPSTRFYADPFLFDIGPDTFLFFEDYDYRTNRGSISYARLTASGIGPALPALSRPYHLSYPFIFEHQGKILMIPETSENNAVELYEAVRFPDEWQLKATLLNTKCSDVTLHWDDQSETWWMFASASKFGTMWDSLVLFHSQSLEGPWRPHAMSPVKYDVTSSRPAGPILRLGSRLLRPAQDCSTGYGDSMVWCEIVDLTPERYTESVVGRVSLSGSRYKGPHTYTRSKFYEAIDLKRTRPRISLSMQGQSSRQVPKGLAIALSH